MRRRLVNSLLFAVAAAFIAMDLWPGSQTSFAIGTDRLTALGLVLILAGLAPLSWRFLGPVSHSRPARFLRVGVYICLLALIPAWAAVDQFIHLSPHGKVPLLLYRTFQPNGRNVSEWALDIVFFFVVAVYAAAFVWMTSRGSRVAPATLTIGSATGIVLGVVMYAIAPLGLGKGATNPWLPGSDVDALVVVAWLLVLCGPWAAACLAYSRYTASSDLPPSRNNLVRQVLAAGLLANLVGALIVVVLGTGTMALMINAPWLRDWLYHGSRLQFGVGWLQPVLRGNSDGIAYSHQIAAVSDWGPLVLLCIGFLVIAVLEVGFVVLCMWGDERVDPDDPRQGDASDEPDPRPASDQPGRWELDAGDDYVASVTGMLDIRELARYPSDSELAASVGLPSISS
jgi:hypothetical protein